jgi:hypothetical protein
VARCRGAARFDTKRLGTAKRLGVLVTVKDRRGYLVRGAAIRLRGTPARYAANGSVLAGFTSRLGQVQLTYRLSSPAFAADR